jgi:hypothetical protein
VVGWLKYLENGENRRAQQEGTLPYDFSLDVARTGNLRRAALNSSRSGIAAIRSSKGRFSLVACQSRRTGLGVMLMGRRI